MKTTLIALIGSGVILKAGSIEMPPTDMKSVGEINPSLVFAWELQSSDPVLYWGATESGGSAYRSETRIFAIYPPEVPISGVIKVLSLHVAIQGFSKSFTVSGNTLTEEVMDVLRQTPSGSTVYCSARVRDEKGVAKVINGKWELR
jgi:hypothetical protein